MKPKTVRVNDKMQRGYTYELAAPPGRGFAEGFEPELTPAEMSPVDGQMRARLNNAAPSVQPHYKAFIPTTGHSAPVLRGARRGFR